MTTDLFAAWLLTIVLHSMLLLCIAFVVDRHAALRARPAWREMLWRAALFGGVVTASVQIMAGAPATKWIALPMTRASAAIDAVAPSTHIDIDMRAAATPSDPNDASPHAARADAEDSSNSLASNVATSASFASRIAGSLPSWPLLLIAGWLAGAAIALSRFGGALVRLTLALRAATPFSREPLDHDAAALAIEARIETPRLATLDSLASPIAAHGRRIVLPAWSVDLLDREQLRAMLAHETAHLARRDPEWKIATAATCALLWCVPFVRVARRRLDEIAEISCDAWAAAHLGDGRSLAECLAECAERRVGFDGGLAPAMASRESPLLRRIDYLIAGRAMNLQAGGARAVVVTLVALAIGAFALPGVSLDAMAAGPPVPPTAPTPPAPPRSTHEHIVSYSDESRGTEHMLMQVGDDRHGYRATIDGKIAFNDAENDVASLQHTASFAEMHDGRTTRVEFANRGGTIERRYFIDDHERPLDADAHAWLAQLIPHVVRETAIDAPARVKRLRARGGADLVLEEINLIESDYARGVYVRELVASGALTPAETSRALDAASRIGSDYEKRNALAAIALHEPLDAAMQKRLFDEAATIGSDHERAELLVAMVPKLVNNDAVRSAWLRAAAGVGSDYEHRRVLTALLDGGKADDASLAAVLDAAQSIGSDYERRALLVGVAERTRDADRLAPTYVDAASKIGSDYERREALVALMRASGFNKAGARAVLESVAAGGSDYERRETLAALAHVMPRDAELVTKYRDVARSLSESERDEAERALGNG